MYAASRRTLGGALLRPFSLLVGALCLLVGFTTAQGSFAALVIVAGL